MASEKNKTVLVPAEVSDRATIGADINELQILHLRAALSLKLTIVSISVRGTVSSTLLFGANTLSWQDQHRRVPQLEGMRCVYTHTCSYIPIGRELEQATYWTCSAWRSDPCAEHITSLLTASSIARPFLGPLPQPNLGGPARLMGAVCVFAAYYRARNHRMQSTARLTRGCAPLLLRHSYCCIVARPDRHLFSSGKEAPDHLSS